METRQGGITMAELWQMPGLVLGEAIAAKEVSATEVLDALLARIT